MSSFIHTWTGSMIYTAALCAILIALTPEGKVKEIVKLMCGIAVTAAIISPIAKPDMTSYSSYLAKYRLEAEKITQSASEENKNLNRSYIEERCEAYILDKAESYGAVINSVKVRAEWSTEGFWYPAWAELDSDAEAKEKLSGIIEAELGIARDDQRWST